MKFSKTLQFLSVLAIAVAVLFTACDITDNDNLDEETGLLSVKLTDAPAAYEAVYINIESVRVKLEEDFDGNGESDEDEEGWITISDDSIRVNLLELQNGNTILLGEEELDAGTYHQIRLVLGEDNAIVIDGESFPLKTPSAQQSGLKLNIDAEVKDDETYVLLIDFNAAKSIVETGNGKFILNPVLRAVALEETGSIEGTVQPDSFQTEVMAITNGDTLTTFTEDDGEFEIIGVAQGTYDVVFNAPDSVAYADTTLTDVEVAVDEDVELGTINLHKL